MAQKELSPAEKEEVPVEFLQLWKQKERLKIYRGLLYRCHIDPKTHQACEQLFVQWATVNTVLRAYHDDSGNFGIQKTEMTLSGLLVQHEEGCRRLV